MKFANYDAQPVVGRAARTEANRRLWNSIGMSRGQFAWRALIVRARFSRAMHRVKHPSAGSGRQPRVLGADGVNDGKGWKSAVHSARFERRGRAMTGHPKRSP
jgi:hypothetical protein